LNLPKDVAAGKSRCTRSEYNQILAKRVTHELLEIKKHIEQLDSFGVLAAVVGSDTIPQFGNFQCGHSRSVLPDTTKSNFATEPAIYILMACLQGGDRSTGSREG
jgi:hypothetical protein